MRAAFLCRRLMFAIGALGCTAACSAPSARASADAVSNGNPCRGRTFDADNADTRCYVPAREVANVPVEAVRIRLPTPATVRSGGTASFVLEIENVSGRPLPLELSPACGAFEAEASNEAAASFESECGGLCGWQEGAQILRVVLE